MAAIYRVLLSQPKINQSEIMSGMSTHLGANIIKFNIAVNITNTMQVLQSL